MEGASQSMAATVNYIWAMMSLKQNGENKSDLAPKARQILAIVLYNKCRSYKFVQASIGIELGERVKPQNVLNFEPHGDISGCRCSQMTCRYHWQTT